MLGKGVRRSQLDGELWAAVAWVIGWVNDIVNKPDQTPVNPEFFFTSRCVLCGVVEIFGAIETLSLIFGNFESDLVLHDQLTKHDCGDTPCGIEITDGVSSLDDDDVPIGWLVVDILSMPVEKIMSDVVRLMFLMSFSKSRRSGLGASSIRVAFLFVNR